MNIGLSTSVPAHGAAPARIEASDRETGEWYATFTLGAYTVALAGPSRRFSEGSRHVDNSRWIRHYPEPFHGLVDVDWLGLALDANQNQLPDILAIAFQYIDGSPPLFEGTLQIAGNAQYGPLSNGSREEGSDFNDYLGIEWEYDGEPRDRPESRQIGCLDCSGFVRMVYGYRQSLAGEGSSSVPLCRVPRADASALPRRAHEMFTSGPGVVLIDDGGSRPDDLDVLSAGDLVFFDADEGDGPRLDHVGIYLGPDTGGRLRFISSRKTANGPTMGDAGGRSVLDGDGMYARAFRAARRI